MKSITKYFNRNNVIALMTSLILIQPLIDIDYLIYPLLNQIGVPLPSTIVYFLGLPFFIILSYVILEKNKKKTFILAFGYLMIIGLYLVAHHLFVKDMFELLYLTNRYKYTLSGEIKYILTLIIPMGLIYAFYRADFNQSLFYKIVIWTSVFIAVPIFLSNLFLFSASTYYQGPTLANFPTWFFGIYDKLNPKALTSRFYFSEGNTTGIVLFALYPIVIRQLFNAKQKVLIFLLVFVQGWSMYILATRVATYGVLLMLAAIIVMNVFLVIIRKEKLQPIVLTGLVSLLVMFYFALPYTPAVKNLKIDRDNDQLVKDDEYLRQQFKDQVDSGDLIPGTAEYNYYYQYIFEQYYWLLTISNEYYKWYYPYQIDPKFYVDLIFEYDFNQRQSGRQFEQIFFDYKWDKLNDTQKMFGFGYSRFMMGSILLEQDFLMQKYTLGYIGTFLLTFPWLAILLVFAYKAIRGFFNLFDFDVLVPLMSFVAILGGAYLSGHVLDQFFSSIYLAFIAAYLWRKLTFKKV